MFSRRDMLAATAASGAMAAATITTADATPVKSIYLRQSERSAPGCDQRQKSKEAPATRSAEPGDQGPVSGSIFAGRRPTLAACR